MVLAEEPLVSEGELVSWHEFLVAGHAPETVQVVDLVLGAHHKVVGAETPATTLTFSTKQPHVVLLAECLAVPDEASAVFVQVHLTL